MAELIVAGLAAVSTPPVLFAFEQLNDALIGKNDASRGKKQEQKPQLGEFDGVLPNLLQPKNVVKGNAGKIEDQKPSLSEAKDVLPNLYNPKNLAKGNAGEKEDQKPKLGEASFVLPPPKNVLKGNATNEVSLVPEPSSAQSSARSSTTAETEPESPFSIMGIVEHHATNPYLLKIPSSHQREQDTSRIVEQDAANPYLLRVPSSYRHPFLKSDTSCTMSFYCR